MSIHTFYIKEPIWNGRRVGLAVDELAEFNQIIIEYKNADGSLLYPNPFYISGKIAREFPIEPAKKNPAVRLCIIPIASLSKLPDEQEKPVAKLVLFTGEEIDITHKQYERVVAALDDNSTGYVEVGNRAIKKTNISLAEGDEEANPSGIDRSPEAVAKRQEIQRKRIARLSKEPE